MSVLNGKTEKSLSYPSVINIGCNSKQTHQELKDGIAKFVVDKNTDCMKMRSALKLITVTPINSISASSNEHMANKVGCDL